MTNIELAAAVLSDRGTDGSRVVLVEKVNKKIVHAVSVVDEIKRLKTVMEETLGKSFVQSNGCGIMIRIIALNEFNKDVNQEEINTLKSLIV